MTEEVVGVIAEEPKEVEKPKNDYEVSGDDETEIKTEVKEPAEDAAEKKPKQKNGFKRKIARLEAEVAQLRQTQPGQSQPEREVKTESVEGKPTPDKYPDYNDYLEALADYKADAKVKQVLDERDKKAREQDHRKILETKRETFEKQKEELRKTAPDLDEVFEAYDDVNINPSLGSAILDSDMAVQVAYEIGKDPEEFKRLNDPKMGVIAINKAIAKIEARLEKSEVKEKAAVTTKAPPPIKPVTRSSSTSSGYSEDDSFETYKQKRASGKI